MTASTFEVSLKQAYTTFEQQAKNNLQQILEQTKKIINEQKPNIAGLTKIDWINIYFESAKNTSDVYMQNVWANVLAKELETPGSFTYKTLDVLKTMSSEHFKLFEKMCSLEILNCILQNDIYKKYGLMYMDLLTLSEYGLINMGLSQRTDIVNAHSNVKLLMGDYLLIMDNPTDEDIKISFSVYVFTSVAQELQKVVAINRDEEYVKESSRYLSKQNDSLISTLHKVISIYEKGIQYQVGNIDF